MMRKYILLCTVSALLGAVFASWRAEPGRDGRLEAQERGRILRTVPDTTLIEDVASDSLLREQLPPEARAELLEEFTPEERVNIAVYEKVNRSVVNITTRSAPPEVFLMLEAPSAGSGSGSVLDNEGHILTNYHVVEGANEIRVTLFNGETFSAGLIGRDAANDIAVLRIEAPREMLHPIEWGESSRLRVGQKVYAVGNPFGLERTLTVGILSSLNRSLPSRTGRDMKAILQIDAALNRGNSGGPLLNSRGLLIGMNTAIASPSGAGENTGVGFAIPVATIQRVVPQLLEHGRVIRPFIGIASVYETDQGLVIVEVASGGPADRAGLRGFRVVRERERRGAFVYERTYVDRNHADLIVAIDGQRVRTGNQLLDWVESKQPGDQVVVRVVRNGQQLDVPVTLGMGE